MKDVVFTFIIPHFNCPFLLSRCISTIPQREDIQIIVVDDNSDIDKKPQGGPRQDIEYIYLNSNESKGAGKARNVGITKAKGKWLLFPDSDDYYNENFIQVLDKYKDADVDVLYFNYNYLDGNSGMMLPVNTLQKTISCFDRMKEKEELIRYKNNTPWTKMVKADFVKQIGAYYEEVPNGNDVLFSLFVGHYAGKIAVNSNCIYNYIRTPNSLVTKKHSPIDLMCKITHLVKHNAFNVKIGHKEWNTSVIKYVAALIRRMEFRDAIALIKILILELPSLLISRNEWVDLVLKPID